MSICSDPPLIAIFENRRHPMAEHLGIPILQYEWTNNGVLVNLTRIYLIIGALIILGIVGILVFTPSGQEEKQPAASAMPPGHPDVGGAEGGAPGQPSKSNVRQDFLQALEDLKTKVDKAPAKDTSGVMQLARMLFDSHKMAEAIPYFERYLNVDKRNTTVMLDLSIAYYSIQKPGKAMEVTEQILKIDPRNTTAMYNIGALHAEAGKKDEAKSVWQNLIDRYPKSEDAARAKEALGKL
jgi:TolA-binding protein